LILIGRPEGKRFLPYLEHRLEELPRRSVMPIDCQHVQVMDISFGDESLGRIARRRTAREYPERYLVLENVGEELEANLQSLCEQREIVLVVTRTGEDLPTLLGELSTELSDTYNIAVREGRLTARELIEQIGGESKLTIAASSNRLTRLEALGVVAQVDAETIEGGGRQKVFTPVY
jgi:hypothetical protein